MAAPPGASRDIRRYFTAAPAVAASTTKRAASPTRSIDGEDPLLRGAALPPRLPELRPGRSPLRSVSAQETPLGRSRIAVVLTASRSGTGSTGPSWRTHEASAPPRPQWPTVTKETPVPLPRIPGWTASRVKDTKAQGPPAPGMINSKGRPKGWKPGMSYSELRGNPPPSSPRTRQARPKAPVTGLPKRRRRSAKALSPPPRDVYRRLEPQFVAFLCEWAGCKAELHNLDTLRRHVYVVHGRGDDTGRRSCRWRKCASEQPAREFACSNEFREHVEEAHLAPLAWHVGDGPRNGDHDGRRATSEPGNVDDIPDFLKDAQGKQVTPSIRDQELDDVATWRTNRRRLKELLLRRDENLPDDLESGDADEA